MFALACVPRHVSHTTRGAPRLSAPAHTCQATFALHTALHFRLRFGVKNGSEAAREGSRFLESIGHEQTVFFVE